jgi:hypothetical protein
MLAEGTGECPRCGALIKDPSSGEEFSRSEIAWFSAYTIGIVLVPIIVGIGIALLCLFLFFR